MSAAHSVARSCARSCARAVNARWGVSYPASLSLLWPLKLTASGVLKSAKGPTPTFTDVPTVTADGVVAGAGPSMGAVARGGGKVLALRVKMTKASTGITGDEQIYGPLYVRNGNLVAKLDGAEATHAHTWAANDVVNVRIEVTPSGLTVGDF